MKPRNEEKKLEIYEYIKRYIREYGVCPSTGEIADGVHCARSTAHKFLVRLEEEGYIEKYVGIRSYRGSGWTRRIGFRFWEASRAESRRSPWRI